MSFIGCAKIKDNEKTPKTVPNNPNKSSRWREARKELLNGLDLLLLFPAGKSRHSQEMTSSEHSGGVQKDPCVHWEGTNGARQK